MDTHRPIVAITLGDPCGIGPEVVVKALRQPDLRHECRPLVVGSTWAVQRALDLVGVPLRAVAVPDPGHGLGSDGLIPVLDPGTLDPADVELARICPLAGRAAMEWVELAARLCLEGRVQAMATAPVNKEATWAAGYREIGHMEFLERLTGAPRVATMLISGGLRVVHLTTHLSLRQACDAVTHQNVLAMLDLTHRCFQEWGIPRPRIGVAALNPHASDGGLLGDEEAAAIAPAVAEARAEGIDAAGPVPADIVFHQALEGRYDVILAMYHDQGHIAVKTHGFERSVSVNLGLPFVRTSVDHGTAFDIAGKGVADAQSMMEAIRLAVSLASKKGLPPAPRD